MKKKVKQAIRESGKEVEAIIKKVKKGSKWVLLESLTLLEKNG